MVRHEIGTDERPSHALVTVVAELRGEAPTGIQPLARKIDLEALDAFMARAAVPSAWSTAARVSFGGLMIDIDPSEIVVTEPPTREGTPERADQ